MDVKTLELDAKGLRDFGITTGLAIAILFGAILPYLFSFGFPRWPWIVGAVLAIWGLAAPMTLQPVYKGWMKFGLLISKVTTPLILGVVFVLLIFPIGFVFRVTGRDIMNRKLDASSKSYKDSTNDSAEHDLGRAVLMIELLKDLWAFMRMRKKYWLAPLVLVMVLLGGLIVFAQGSALAPFIYTLF